MTELLTAARMRAIEQAAIASGEVTGLELMERAGRGVVAAILEEWPELAKTSHRAVVLCGPGNNGGDGFVVARLLKERGWEVAVFLYGDPDKQPPDAKANHARWRGETNALSGLQPYLQTATGPAVVIDACFGTGLSRPLPEDVAGAFRNIRDHADAGPFRLVAVDVPSGLCADSGKIIGSAGAPRADLTVTFHGEKLGHRLAQGPSLCGTLTVTDIGIAKWSGQGLADSAGFATTRRKKPHPGAVRLTTARTLPALPKGADTHKFSHGHALILAGHPGKGGAARLAARGALRVGAGLVTVGCLPAALQENAARLDAVMLKPVHDADALARILGDLRINALCLGPGLGEGEREAALVAVALGVPAPGSAPDLDGKGAAPEDRGPGSGPERGGHRRPVVLDADALTMLSRHPDLFAALHDRCVLTPHAGEFARLFPDIAERLNTPATTGPAFSKVDATREAAARAGCTILFKGPDTVIADPDGGCAITSAHYDRAAPWLATAGSGDVLAGFIAGLLARGFPPMQAAETAAWLHVGCALSFGPGLIAEDLPEALPKVFRALGL